jgi:DNA-binding NarL/FixJ family response regulator
MSGRALVVEDDPSWQKLLAEILGDCGLAVDLAEGLETSLPVIRSRPHRIAVLDLSLGGPDHNNQDGLLVLEAVRRHDPGCASIVLTGFATVELAVSVIQQKGAFTCLRKESFRRADFRKVVTQALAAAPPVTNQGAGGEPAESRAESAPGGLEPPGKDAARGLALVVEDDAGWRSLLSELLSDAGFQVRQSISYVEALGMLRSGDYRLAVVDLSLASSLHPGSNQDGYSLLADTQRAGIPTIIVSGYADPAGIQRAYADYGLFACLEKQAFDRKKFVEMAQDAGQLADAGSGLHELTGRERQVLALLAQGYTNKQIASTLFITQNTVKQHVMSLFATVGVGTRAAASAIAARAGIKQT